MRLMGAGMDTPMPPQAKGGANCKGAEFVTALRKIAVVVQDADITPRWTLEGTRCCASTVRASGSTAFGSDWPASQPQGGPPTAEAAGAARMAEQVPDCRHRAKPHIGCSCLHIRRVRLHSARPNPQNPASDVIGAVLSCDRCLHFVAGARRDPRCFPKNSRRQTAQSA